MKTSLAKIPQGMRRAWGLGSTAVMGAALLTSTLLVPSTASANWILGAELGGASRLDGDAAGTSALGRLGLGLDIPLLRLSPEIAIGYENMDGDQPISVLRPEVGLRVGLGELFRFSGFAHLGQAQRSSELGRDSFWATTWDAGLGFGFTLLPLFNVGVQAAYVNVAGDGASPAVDYGTAGVHLELVL